MNENLLCSSVPSSRIGLWRDADTEEVERCSFIQEKLFKHCVAFDPCHQDT